MTVVVLSAGLEVASSFIVFCVLVGVLYAGVIGIGSVDGEDVGAGAAVLFFVSLRNDGSGIDPEEDCVGVPAVGATGTVLVGACVGVALVTAGVAAVGVGAAVGVALVVGVATVGEPVVPVGAGAGAGVGAGVVVFVPARLPVPGVAPVVPVPGVVVVPPADRRFLTDPALPAPAGPDVAVG